jgi:uncharacterized protein
MRVRLSLVVVSLLTTPLLAFAYYLPGPATGYVNDFAKLLSDSEKEVLEQKLSAFNKETSNQIAVATIESLRGDTIENFATKLFADWAIGTKQNDNGILLLVARDDRKVRIEVGYGLEGALTDIQANDIIENDIVPAFREEQYAEGINRATDNIMAATQGEYEIQSSVSGFWRNLEKYGGFIFFFVIVILQWLGAVLARSKSWWGGGIVGAVLSIIIGLILGWLFWGLIALILLIPLGLLFDFVVSRTYKKRVSQDSIPWWIGGGHGGGSDSGSSFGGFGGGSSGGGGASGGW